MYIEQAFKSKTDWWRYLLGLIVIFIFWQLIGSIPLLAAVSYSVMQDGGSFTELANMDVLMNTLDRSLTLFLLLLSFAIGFLGLLLSVKYIHKQTILEATTSRPKFDWNRFGVGFALIAITTTTLTLVSFYFYPDDYVVQFQWDKFIILFVVVLIMMPLQTSFEEYLFRGYLMQGLGVLVRNRWFPLIFTSVVFGLVHLANPEVDKLGPLIMIYYIGVGFLLGIMTLMDEGMELALGYHAGNNMVAALLVTADWTAFQTDSILLDVSEPEIGLDVLVPVLVIYPLYLIILAKLYNWTNWKDKLFGKVVKPKDIEEFNPIDRL